MDYDDFSMQEIRDMEYAYLKSENKKKERDFQTLFDGFGKMFNKILKSFKG